MVREPAGMVRLAAAPETHAEPHTELIKRGKAGKDIEFGHMVQIEQVEGKFVTRYEVFEKKPLEHQLVKPAIEHHKHVFGSYPEALSADKGYYESVEQINELAAKVNVVGIGKKGKRDEEESQRERSPSFRIAQRFRAGIEERSHTSNAGSAWHVATTKPGPITLPRLAPRS